MLQNDEQEVLSDVLEAHGNRPFLRNEAQSIGQAVMINAYTNEEQNFLNNVKILPRSSNSWCASIISSHTVYKLKQIYDKSLRLKAHIATHGDENSDKDNLHTECCMGPPVGIWIVATTPSTKKWRIVRMDAESSLLQTAAASRKVYVIPSSEFSHRYSVLWHLLPASYGLFNSNYKWKGQSGDAFVSFGFEHVALVPQLVNLRENGEVILPAIKIVDAILFTGTDASMHQSITNFNRTFKLRKVAHGPEILQFYCMNIM